MGPAEKSPERHRLDTWLWFARLYKTRSTAAEAVSGGKVKLNGERVKPSHGVHLNDRLTLSLDQRRMEIDVLGFPARRGPAKEAQEVYAETSASVAHAEASREQRRLSALVRPQPDARPEKRERRALQKLRRDQF